MHASAEFDIQAACPSLARSMEGALLSYCGDITLNDSLSPWVWIDLDIDKPHDYVGKAALQAIAKTGPERRWSVPTLAANRLPNQHFMDVKSGDEVIGHVTRYCWSPRLNTTLHLSTCPAPWPRPAQRSCSIPAMAGHAEVVDIPWIPRESHSCFLNEFQLAIICAFGVKASELGKPTLYF